MRDWLRVLLAAASVYRTAQLITIDEGPFSVFQSLRDAAGTYDRGPNGVPYSVLGRALGCPYCVGVYIAFGAALLVLRPSILGDLLLTWLGLAGLAAWLQGPRNAE